MDAMQNSLTENFHRAMLSIYEQAANLTPPYRATDFKRMVSAEGGKAAADKLLATSKPSSGFTELYLRGSENLKLSVEYLVLKPEWRSLFTDEQRAIALKRLKEVGCPPPIQVE